MSKSNFQIPLPETEQKVRQNSKPIRKHFAMLNKRIDLKQKKLDHKLLFQKVWSNFIKKRNANKCTTKEFKAIEKLCYLIV